MASVLCFSCSNTVHGSACEALQKLSGGKGCGDGRAIAIVFQGDSLYVLFTVQYCNEVIMPLPGRQHTQLHTMCIFHRVMLHFTERTNNTKHEARLDSGQCTQNSLWIQLCARHQFANCTLVLVKRNGEDQGAFRLGSLGRSLNRRGYGPQTTLLNLPTVVGKIKQRHTSSSAAE